MFAWHGEYDEAVCDQRDESQWEYYVVRSDDLPQGQKSMSLSRLQKLTEPVSAQALAAAVEKAVIHSADCWCAECKEVWTDIVPYWFDRELEAEAENDP